MRDQLQPTRRRRRTRWALLWAALIVLPACAKEPPPNTYPEDVVANFMTGCRRRASESICGCALRRIQQRWTADEFREIDATLGDQAAAQIADTVAACAGR